MSEIFVSPGLYVREYDFSYYTSSASTSSLALVGETLEGPAFKPTKITNIAEFREKFGNYDPTKLVGYCAKSYFKYANDAYIVRVLGSSTLRQAGLAVLPIRFVDNNVTADPTFADEVIAELLVPTGVSYEFQIAEAVADGDEGFAVSTATLSIKIGTSANLAGTTDLIYNGQINFVNSNSPYYVEKIFPRNKEFDVDGVANETLDNCATMMVFPTAGAEDKYLAADLDIDATGTFTRGHLLGGDAIALTSTFSGVTGYNNASTPWISSNLDGDALGVPLFMVHTQADGQIANTSIKVEIKDIDDSAKTFSLIVRDFSDTNAQVVMLESFTKLTMDKSSENYIAKRIGDNIDEMAAKYPLISTKIYVETASNDAGELTGLLPAGFRKSAAGTSGSTASTVIGVWPEFVINSTEFTGSTTRESYGIDVAATESDLLMGNHNSQYVLDGNTFCKGFHLDSGADNTEYVPGPLLFTGYTKQSRKFVVPFLGGNEGWQYDRDPAATMLNPDNETTGITAAYVKAFDTIRSAEEYDVNLLAVPGVAINTNAGVAAVELAEERADMFYVADFPETAEGSDVDTAVTTAIGKTLSDTNYAGTYFPYVKIYDVDNGEEVLIPPTPQVLEAMAYTDQVSYPWFAPAGMQRGLLTDIIRTQFKLTQDHRDLLYTENINPIATLPGQGYAIWGQKTLQTRTTSLDRINVRRMMIYVEKVIAGVTQYLVFEQNDAKTRDRFLNMVQPILDRIKIKQGLYDFRVICDETNNPDDVIDRGQMNGDIWLKPTKSAEAIKVGFNLMSTGASFDEVEA